MLQNLPIGTQSFEKLRKRAGIYVDKTQYILQMLNTTGTVYFLSRPRRFGKSLLISTLEAVFRGRKELFEGLYIYDKWDWNDKFPVIHLDFGKESHSTGEELTLSLTDFVDATARDNQISLQKHTLTGKFSELIQQLHETTGQQVVVLVDEYDKPITDHLSNQEVLEANKTVLHDFYQVLKAADDHIRFIFLTGVSKFSGLSVFSALNNPHDITISEDYAALCGYTQDELEKYFAEHIDNYTHEKNVSRQDLLDDIKRWYDGYSWDGKTSVYNPFSTLMFFAERSFDNYWFRTGTPTFLMELLKSRNQITPILENKKADSGLFEGYDTADLDEIALLFQTGYLTIKDVNSIDPENKEYTLGIPNSEVRNAFFRRLLSAYSHYPVSSVQRLILDMQQQIYNSDTSGLEQNLRMLLANIPYILHQKNEAYYHSMFLVWMKMLGFEPQGEVPTSTGRIDSVLHHADLTVVAEIKYSAKKGAEKLLNEAMTQIRDRRYYERYLDRKVILMAVAFAGKEVRCRLEGLEIQFPQSLLVQEKPCVHPYWGQVDAKTSENGFSRFRESTFVGK
ncbi:MAG: ATP-binding protein [Tannerella sp.]|jgi:hypothetical protein|nr:ATP-binding protein [Tannerella sp.]